MWVGPRRAGRGAVLARVALRAHRSLRPALHPPGWLVRADEGQNGKTLRLKRKGVDPRVPSLPIPARAVLPRPSASQLKVKPLL